MKKMACSYVLRRQHFASWSVINWTHPSWINLTLWRIDTLYSRRLVTRQLTEKIGFNRNDARRVYTALQIPDHFTLNEGRHTFHLSGPILLSVSCKAYILYRRARVSLLLFRLHSPQQRKTLDSHVWGYDYSALSKMFSAVETYVDNSHRHRLRIVPEIAHKFSFFNLRICDKLMSLYGELPP